MSEGGEEEVEYDGCGDVDWDPRDCVLAWKVCGDLAEVGGAGYELQIRSYGQSVYEAK